MSGYQRLDQEDRGDGNDPDTWRPDRTSTWAAGARGRARTNSSIDIKAINARLERWADEITSKFNFRNKKGQDDPAREVYHSVFICPPGYEPQQAEQEDEHGMSALQFDETVDGVRYAISQGIHPQMIRQGSSGSYFARDRDGRIVAVFKPKNEEPYGKLNPKWTKWLHRNLFPCFFGRSCLIPNLSYISEAAAFLLDKRLQTFLVPYTDIIWLSSKSFHYDFWDRRSYYRKGKPLPPKVGSFQVFLEGYQDANLFLKDHPWPEGPVTRYSKNSRRGKRWVNRLLEASPVDEGYEDEDLDSQSHAARANDVNTQPQKFAWTGSLQQAFREELEKLVILDYIMRNTGIIHKFPISNLLDRGLDNWMVKVKWDKEKADSPAETPKGFNVMNGEPEVNSSILHAQPVYQHQQPMVPSRPSSSTPANFQLSLGAIDNSLAFPWKHPDQWRSFPFGWLFLPVGLIGQPFSAKTRDHFLPILTSTKWWTTTTAQLRELFCQDSDFQERMFARQMAVLKGQAWNVVETLKQQDQGPLELTRRPRVHVWSGTLIEDYFANEKTRWKCQLRCP